MRADFTYYVKSYSTHLKGQLESTILTSYVQAAKLKAWLARDSCPPAIKECRVLFEKAFATKGDTSLDGGDELLDLPDVTLSSTSSTQSHIIPPDLHKLISGHNIILHARHHVNGVMYARRSTHTGNSLVTFYPGGDTSLPAVPGSIKYIFEHNGKISFALQRQCPARNDILDPFRHYPYFPARLYYASLSLELEEVNPSWVVSHYIRWSYSPTFVVVLALSRVRSFLHE